MIKQLTLSITFFLVSIIGAFSYGQMISYSNSFNIITCDGTATFLQASSYSSPDYSWHWDADVTLQQGGTTFIGLCPFDYSFHLDSSGIEIYSENFTIGSNDPCLGLHVSSFAWLPTAPDGCTGYISSGIAGGTQPYTYNWNTGATTPGILNLCAGNYSLTVHDANGCSNSMELTIGVDSTLSAEFQSYVQPWPTEPGLCTGTAGIVASGGVAPYTYDWSTGTGTEYLYNLCEGNYSVTVHDASGDSIVLNFTIAVNCQGFSIASLNATPTYSTTCSGSISANVIGGTEPYYYTWSNDMLNEFPNDASISNLCFGSYSFQVIDSFGCSLSDSIQIIVGVPTILANLTTEMDLSGNCTGTAEISPQGGVGPYTVSWSNGDTTNTTDNLCAGIYFVDIADAYGTTAILSFAITDSSSTYGSNPYADSTVVGYLYNYLLENCTIDYWNIDSASLSDAVYDSVSQNLYVTWAIYTSTGIVYINDTLGFNGGSGVYNLEITVFCPQKSIGNYMSIHGQLYMQGNNVFLSVKENDPLVVQVFPNPFSDEFSVSLNEIGDYRVLLNDALGRNIQTAEFTQSNQFVIRPEYEIANGNYFLVIESSKGRTILKLIH
jgi:hypothetical protein